MDGLTNDFIPINKRRAYKDVKSLENDERKLELSFKNTKNKFQKLMFLPLGLHLMTERKRLVGLTIKERVQFKTLKVQTAIFKKKLKAWGVMTEEWFMH